MVNPSGTIEELITCLTNGREVLWMVVVVAKGGIGEVIFFAVPYPAARKGDLQCVIILLLCSVWSRCVVKVHQAEIPCRPFWVIVYPIYLAHCPLQPQIIVSAPVKVRNLFDLPSCQESSVNFRRHMLAHVSWQILAK